MRPNRTSRFQLAIASVITGATLTVAGAARADDAATCGAAYEQGQALRAQHKLIAARQQLLACAAATCSQATRSDCQQWLGEVQQLQPTVLFDVTDDGGHPLTAVRVTMDGAPLVDHLDGTSMPIDPGTHTFVFTADGMTAATTTYPVRESLKDQRVQVTMKSTARAATPSSATPAVTSGTTTSNPTPTAPVDDGAPRPAVARSSPLKTVGFVVGGVGLAGIILGSVFGGMAISDNNDAGCDPNNVCTNPQSRRDAQGAATVSTIGFVAGGVLLATGVALVIVGSKHHGGAAGSAAHVELAPAIGMGSAGFSLGGGF
jgi:hypothetical protein